MLKKTSRQLILDIFSLKDIRLTAQRQQAIADYCWDHYSHFAHQRSLIFDKLKNSLAGNCKTFAFYKWQRVVSYQFSLMPLSAKGSILNAPGGRFNIGDIDQSKFPKFAGLYLAEDRETAYKEKFGLNQKGKISGLTAEDLTLTSQQSITIVCIQGEMKQTLDLRNPNSLNEFFNLVKEIKLPKSFVTRANKLNIDPMYEIKSLNVLIKDLLQPNWRGMPMVYDIPANSQILGQIAHAAGIEAILYPSAKKSEKNCLVVFPENLAQSASHLEIEDNTPSEIKFKRLDSHTYINSFR